MLKLYHVYLSHDQRQQVEHVISRGKSSARVITRAPILLWEGVHPPASARVDTIGIFNYHLIIQYKLNPMRGRLPWTGEVRDGGNQADGAGSS